MKQRKFVTLIGATLLMAGTAVAQQEQSAPPSLDATMNQAEQAAAQEAPPALDAPAQAQAPAQEAPPVLDAPAQAQAPAQEAPPALDAPAQAQAPAQEAPPALDAPAQTQAPAQEAPPALDAPAQAPAQAPATPQQSPGMGSMNDYLADREAGMKHKFGRALQYYLEYNPNATPEDFEKMRPYLKPFTDVEIMADMMTDPRKMAAWMDAITEPDAIYLLMKCSQEPVMWDTWMRGLTDFPALTRALFRFLDPTTYMNWAAAMFDPNLYGTMAKMIDPNKYVRWGYASGNLKFYEPMIQWLYPSWWDPRVQWLMDPQTFQPVLDLFAIPQPQPQS